MLFNQRPPETHLILNRLDLLLIEQGRTHTMGGHGYLSKGVRKHLQDLGFREVFFRRI